MSALPINTECRGVLHLRCEHPIAANLLQPINAPLPDFMQNQRLLHIANYVNR
jgi:hypothetical protein